MKSILSIILICMTVLASCTNKEESAGDGSGSNSEKYSITLPVSTESIKTTWLVGDKFVVHGEYSKDQLPITLTADDISEDGKTCYVSVEGVAPYEQKITKTQFYIAYPGEMVQNDSHCKDASRFNGTNGLLMAGYNKDKSFVLESLVGGFSFIVNGDFDSYDFRGNNEEIVGYTSLTSRITDNAKIYAQSKGEELTIITGDATADGKTINHVCFTGSLSFTDGFQMTFYKDGAPSKTLYTKQSYDIGHNKFIALGDITSSLTDYKAPIADTHVSAIPVADAVDLSAAESANCYIVTRPGIYAFKALKGYSTEALPYSIGYVEVLWETWGTTEEVIPNSVIAQVDFEKDMVYFRVAEDNHPGNAVIAVRNDMGDIMWSWHIWVPETTVNEDLYGLSRRMSMDRNLGALVEASADGASPKSVGLFYQWGRKDPFVGIGDFSTGEPASVAGQSMTLSGGQMSTAQSMKNPTAFANMHDEHWSSTPSDARWDQKKTMYDPCPPGYKVPYRSEYLLFTNTPQDLLNWEYTPSCNVFSIGSPVTVYPLGGYITTDGVYSQFGEGTRVWSSRTYSTASDAYNFRIFADNGSPSYGNGSKPKSNGFAVRCVRYDSTPFENAPGTPTKGSYKKYNVNIKELSGLYLHTDGSFLWGVGDNGTLAKIGFDGNVENVFSQSLDMEGVTVDPATGDLYLGCEPNDICKVEAPEYKRAVHIFDVAEASSYGNSGVEGISWYKDDMILVGTQTGAYMWAYTLDGTVVWKKSMRTIAIGMQEIADIYYDSIKDQIWIIDSETQSIYLFNGDATEHLATYKVSYGGNCESICVDYNNSCVWIADDDDSSLLIKVDFEF